MAKKPEITPEVIAAAKANPNGWVYKIDWEYGPDDYTPPEAIVGAWEVDSNGELTGLFTPNENHSPVIMAKRKPREYMERCKTPDERNVWALEVDPKYDDQFPEFPLEGQIGTWYIGHDNEYTGHFRPNRLYTGDIVT